MDQVDENGKPLKGAQPGGIESQDDNIKEAKTPEEASAPCPDCNAVFMTPHKSTCPQILMGKEIQRRQKEAENAAPKELSCTQAIDNCKEHMITLGKYLSDEVLSGLHHDNYLKLMDGIRGAVRNDGPKKK